jgi:hypothetical protein
MKKWPKAVQISQNLRHLRAIFVPNHAERSINLKK